MSLETYTNPLTFQRLKVIVLLMLCLVHCLYREELENQKNGYVYVNEHLKHKQS